MPNYATHEGEAAFYASGTERRFYGYINGVWCNFKFETTGELISNAIWDEDGDTGITTEKNADEDILRFGTNGTERMLIDSNGIDMKTNKILNVVDPTSDQHGATKKYVDTASLWSNASELTELKTAEDISIQGHQIKDMRIENRTSDPASPGNGQIWYRVDL